MSRIGLLTFCIDKDIDQVAPLAFKVAERQLTLQSTGINIDGFNVLLYKTSSDDNIYFIRTNKVMPHDYPHYIPLFKQHFPTAEFVLVVNWHEGIDAPDPIITLHSNGNVATGHFSRVSPAHMRNLLIWSDHYRKELGLNDFRVLTEVTHWSGLIRRQDPSQIESWDIPVYDFEIGSSPSAWGNEVASEVLIRASLHTFDEQKDFFSLFCVGGMHFQKDNVKAVLMDDPNIPIAISHIIHTKWMESSEYLGDIGIKRFKHCINTIEGDIHAIVFHDKIRGPYKQILRMIADEMGISSFHHKRLRQLELMLFDKKT